MMSDLNNMSDYLSCVLWLQCYHIVGSFSGALTSWAIYSRQRAISFACKIRRERINIRSTRRRHVGKRRTFCEAIYINIHCKEYVRDRIVLALRTFPTTWREKVTNIGSALGGKSRHVSYCIKALDRSYRLSLQGSGLTSVY